MDMQICGNCGAALAGPAVSRCPHCNGRQPAPEPAAMASAPRPARRPRPAAARQEG